MQRGRTSTPVTSLERTSMWLTPQTCSASLLGPLQPDSQISQMLFIQHHPSPVLVTFCKSRFMEHCSLSS